MSNSTQCGDRRQGLARVCRENNERWLMQSIQVIWSLHGESFCAYVVSTTMAAMTARMVLENMVTRMTVVPRGWELVVMLRVDFNANGNCKVSAFMDNFDARISLCNCSEDRFGIYGVYQKLLVRFLSRHVLHFAECRNHADCRRGRYCANYTDTDGEVFQQCKPASQCAALNDSIDKHCVSGEVDIYSWTY